MSAELALSNLQLGLNFGHFLTILDSISRLTSICFKVGHNPTCYPSTTL